MDSRTASGFRLRFALRGCQVVLPDSFMDQKVWIWGFDLDEAIGPVVKFMFVISQWEMRLFVMGVNAKRVT